MVIDLIVIKTPRPQQLADFYSLLGIEFDYHNHGSGPFHYAAKINDTVLEIYPLPKNLDKADDTLRLGFSIKKLNEVVEKLRTRGVKIIKEPSMTEWGYQALVEDLDGRKVELKDEDIPLIQQ
jgi:hypothetical protein